MTSTTTVTPRPPVETYSRVVQYYTDVSVTHLHAIIHHFSVLVGWHKAATCSDIYRFNVHVGKVPMIVLHYSSNIILTFFNIEKVNKLMILSDSVILL